ncbi:cysteine desulfurase [Thermincola ferriacetica]|uniref:cysteine desulfurase n=1 Tax=Thermincola ferriacetica TaxID=281456 RepID=A0A0L6W3N5_9FIRM|nr:aminotransferase class V-fold PLP-dependent enzyme [Thermincola ferriacetica]KNZ69704.1 cysteine desulfurase [Thermincola ferriacetica]
MIYLDNAASSWPKPEQVIQAVTDCLRHAGANPGRGGHKMSLAAGRIVYETRELVAQLFNIKDPLRVAFTSNATEAINIALKGLLQPGDHVVTTSMEHNSVVRPLKVLEKKGIEYTEVTCSREGFLDVGKLTEALKPNTKCIVMTHASNVTGTLMPVAEVGKIAKAKGITFMVDAAQTAGVYDIDVEKMNIDLLAFPGHKGLYGPQGTGGLYVREGVDLTTLKEGGTGSNSESPWHPDIMPDRLESGTLNTPGLAGLGAGIRFIMDKGLDVIRRHENHLMQMLIDGLKKIDGVILYGPADVNKQAPVLSFNIGKLGSSEVAFMLDKVFDIACRSGLHCAPRAHRTMGTLEQGTVRLSVSYFNTEKDIEAAVAGIKQIAEEV